MHHQTFSQVKVQMLNECQDGTRYGRQASVSFDVSLCGHQW